MPLPSLPPVVQVLPLPAAGGHFVVTVFFLTLLLEPAKTRGTPNYCARNIERVFVTNYMASREIKVIQQINLIAHDTETDAEGPVARSVVVPERGTDVRG